MKPIYFELIEAKTIELPNNNYEITLCVKETKEEIRASFNMDVLATMYPNAKSFMSAVTSELNLPSKSDIIDLHN